MADTALPTTPVSAPRLPEGDENVGCMIKTEATKLTDINESRAELLARVQSLKKDLKEWRGKLDTQVKTYRQELGDLRSTLNIEVEQLKNEFQDLRTSLKKQLDATSKLSSLIPDRLSSPMQVTTEQTVRFSSPRKISDAATQPQLGSSPRKPLLGDDASEVESPNVMAKLVSPTRTRAESPNVMAKLVSPTRTRAEADSHIDA